MAPSRNAGSSGTTRAAAAWPKKFKDRVYRTRQIPSVGYYPLAELDPPSKDEKQMFVPKVLAVVHSTTVGGRLDRHHGVRGGTLPPVRLPRGPHPLPAARVLPGRLPRRGFDDRVVGGFVSGVVSGFVGAGARGGTCAWRFARQRKGLGGSPKGSAAPPAGPGARAATNAG